VRYSTYVRCVRFPPEGSRTVHKTRTHLGQERFSARFTRDAAEHGGFRRFICSRTRVRSGCNLGCQAAGGTSGGIEGARLGNGCGMLGEILKKLDKTRHIIRGSFTATARPYLAPPRGQADPSRTNKSPRIPPARAGSAPECGHAWETAVPVPRIDGPPVTIDAVGDVVVAGSGPDFTTVVGLRADDGLPAWQQNIPAIPYLSTWNRMASDSVGDILIATDDLLVKLRGTSGVQAWESQLVCPSVGTARRVLFSEIVQQAWAQRRPDCRYLFHEDGKPLGQLRSEWNRACRKAGFPVGRKAGGYAIHGTRHSALSNMTAAGIPAPVAMSISGHRTTSEG